VLSSEDAKSLDCAVIVGCLRTSFFRKKGRFLVKLSYAPDSYDDEVSFVLIEFVTAGSGDQINLGINRVLN